MIDVSKLRAQAQFDLCHKGPTQVPTMTLIELLNRLEELERQLASKESEIRALSGPRRMALHNDDGETYRAPPGGWTCFHCGEVLETEHEARAHFGGDPQATPTCQELALEAESYKLAAQAANQLLEATRDERDALAAHVEEVQSTLDHDFTTDTARMRKLREVMAKGPAASLSSHDFNLGIKFAQEHRADLARLKAQWQAGILHKACDEGKWGCELRHMAFDLERQATEGQPS